ncbi:MAG TPA: SirB2 family protein [Chitinophagales bacterium]|nr:SirB2 family protein [Chitinophagales bacterium]HNM32017.1 SirB2 family protein [Chitinophagales bacterium]
MDFQQLLHVHFGFAALFLISYTIKSAFFLTGKREAFLSYKKKTLIVETLFSVGFLVSGIILAYMLIGFGGWQHWLDPKITLALIGIPVGIVGFKKENKTMVAVSLAFFAIAMIIGLAHFH